MKAKDNTGLSDDAKKARAEYARAWRKKNPDKQRAINARYWEKRAAKLAEENNKNVQ